MSVNNKTAVVSNPLAKPIGTRPSFDTRHLYLYMLNFVFLVDAQLRDASEGQFDGFEGGFEAIIVEVDWNSPAFAGRSKRQTGLSSGTSCICYPCLVTCFNLSDFHVDFLRSSAVCGKRSVSFDPPRPTSSRLGRVVNGVDAPVGAFPWQVKKSDPSNPMNAFNPFSSC